MSKRVLEFDELKEICSHMAKKIAPLNPGEIIAVSRGGLVPATLIAKELRLPVGMFSTQKRRMFQCTDSTDIVIVEDLVAQGRTYELLRSYFRRTRKKYKWHFAPVLVDGAYPEDFPLAGFRSSQWITMPWENDDLVVEGDRGLFREGTDQYVAS